MIGMFEEKDNYESDFQGGDLWDSDSSGPPIAKRASKIEAKKTQSTQEETKKSSSTGKERQSLNDLLGEDCVQPDYDQEMQEDEQLCDSDWDRDSDGSEISQYLNGVRYTTTKTSKKGAYEFHFMQDADFLAKSAEEQEKFLELQRALRIKRQLMKERFDSRMCINDFIETLLTGDILKQFVNTHGYKDFKNRVLPINFDGGHAQYLQKWRHLFYYETYNILINNRRSNSKEEDYAIEQNKMRGGNSRARKMNWVGYAVCGIEGEFQSLRLYDAPPHAGDEAKSIAKKTKDPYDTNLMNMKRIKQDDLLILSELKLDLGGQDDVKQGGGGSSCSRFQKKRVL